MLMTKSSTKDIFSSFEKDEKIKNGLPPLAYLSDEFFEIEGKYLFANSWSFVGFAHEISRVGDIKPIQVAGQPLFIIRSSKKKIRAFHNVCSHRSTKLINNPQNCKKLITCPYHRWSYNLNGELLAAPFFGGQKTKLPKDFKLKNYGLGEVSCMIFKDWIFVNLNNNNESFEEYLKPLKKQLSGINLGSFVPVASIEFKEIKANWKFLMENFIEPYHVQFVHKTTTSQPLSDHFIINDQHCLGSGVNLSIQQQAKAKKGSLAASSRYLTLFPNFVLGIYFPDQIGVHLNHPISSGITNQIRVIYKHKDSDNSAKNIKNLKTLWENVHKEDHEICESLQKGRHSVFAEQGGLLSPHWEVSVRKFQELIVNSIRPALIKNSIQKVENA